MHLRPSAFATILAICGLALGLIAGVAEATIPGAPPWGSNYMLVFSQDYTTMSSLSQVGISSNTTIGSGQEWVPTRIPSSLNWNDFIYTSTNNDPFGIDGSPSYLDIRAQDNGNSDNGFDGYTDGLMESMDGSGNGFAQEYGYFECSMWTPGGANTWPAFWLLDEPGLLGQTPDSVEIDVSESYGNGGPNTDATTWHWWNGSNDPSNGIFTPESGMTTGYHQYGVDIEPTGLTYYFDRQSIWNVPASELPSPNMLNRAFYLLINLALGGGSYNNSTGTGYDYSLTPNPSDLKVQYVGVWASPASPNYPEPPGAPTGLTATAGDQVVELAWNSTLGATSYNVYRGTSHGGESGTPIATGITGTSFNDTGLTNGTTYYYTVAAVNSHGASSPSTEASATPRAGPPLPPAGLTITQGNSMLTLNWTGSPDATSFDIYRGNSAGGESGTPIATGVTGSTFTDTAVTNGQPYFYYVEGVNSLGNSTASNEANAIPASSDGSCPVAYASSPPPINGTDNASWANATVLPINHLDLGYSTSSDGTFATMWDSNYLYVLFTVNCSLLVAGTPNYNGSAVEFYIDTNNSKAQSNGPSDFRYTLGYNGTSITEDDQGATTGVEFAQSTYSGGYREEIAIPWSTLGVTPWSGQSIGIDAAIDDSTNASSGRTDQLFWYNPYPTDYYDPQGFGNGTLDPANPNPPAPGTYELVNVNSGLALEVPGGTVGNGTDLDQAAYTGATYQQWSVQQGFAGGYYLQNVATGQVADTGPSFSNTDLVNEWNANSIPDNDYTQLYTIVKLGSYYQIDDIWSGRVLDISGGSTSSGANIIQNNAAQNDNSQLWNLVLISGGAPGAPSGLAATPGNAQVTLNWNASAGATSYNVYRGTSSGGESGTPVATGVTGTSYTNTGLTNGTTYYYTVAAVNSSGTSAKSNEASATPSAGGAPSAPTGLTATGGSAQVSLTWTASSGATSYNIYRGTSSGGEGGSPIATGVTGTSYTNTGLSAGTTYYYEVTAVSSGGESGKSNQASATTVPPAPTGLTATAGDAQVSLTWSAASGATSYKVYRGTSAGGESGTPVATVSSASYTDTGLTNSTTYYYKVAAVNAAGTSGQSGEASATPQASVPPAPTGLTASGGNGSVSLAWTGSAGATSYNVYRGTSSGGESGTPIATGVTAIGYTDTSVTNGTTYYYKVAAVNAAGTSGKSNEASATPSSGGSGTPVLQIDCGANFNTGSWLEDQDYSGGTVSYTTDTINTSLLTNAPPQTVLQYIHYATNYAPFSYTLPGFTPGASYTVKLYFVETWWTGSGERECNVTINGSQVLTDFDIYAAAGGKDIAIAKSFNTTADSNGNITITFTSVVDEAEVSGVEVDTGSGGSVPSAPTGLTATAGNAQVALAWNASAGATSYNVYRGTSSGGESASPIANVTGTSYTDTGLTNGSTYYYKVAAVNSAGTSAMSSEASASPSSGSSGGQPVLQVNCGANFGTGNWVADEDYSNSSSTYTTATINTSLLANAPPQSVLQYVRYAYQYNPFTYTLPGFTPGGNYTVKLYFVETWFTSAGNRVANVLINGNEVLSNFDIYAAAGGTNIAICKCFHVTANSSGDIVIEFDSVRDNAEVSGIEIDSGSSSAAPSAPTGLSASLGNSAIDLTWTPSTGATSYNVYRGTTSGGESSTPIAANVVGNQFNDSTVVSGTTYYYKVTAVNSSGMSGYSNEASATASSGTPVLQIFPANFNDGSWHADEDVSGGTVSYTTSAIDTSHLTNPPPQTVLQWFHYSNNYGSFTYTLPGFTAGANYTVKLYFEEEWWTGPGEREFNVKINSNQVLTDFDIYAASGGQNIAIMEPFNVTANSSGDIVIEFDSVVDNAMVTAIEVDSP